MSIPNIEYYQTLADMFDYPTSGYPVRVKIASETLRTKHPEAYAEVEEFRANLPEDDLYSMQELYTRSFDVQAITTLDIGYVLFGDDYKRGELLSHLNQEHHQVGNNCPGRTGRPSAQPAQTPSPASGRRTGQRTDRADHCARTETDDH